MARKVGRKAVQASPASPSLGARDPRLYRRRGIGERQLGPPLAVEDGQVVMRLGPAFAFNEKGELVLLLKDPLELQAGSPLAVAIKAEAILTPDEKRALEGTHGKPGRKNRLVTDSDPRNADARDPTSHADTHVDGSDPLPAATDSTAGLLSATDKAKLDGIQAGAQVNPTWIETRGATVISPTAPLDVIVWRAPFACTVTNVRGYRVGGTGAAINARRNGIDAHLAGDASLSSADTWIDGGAVSNAAYAAGDKLEIQIASLGGSPTQIAVQVDFTRP